MRIIFDSNDQKEEFFEHMAKICTWRLNLDGDCNGLGCKICWEKAIESEVKPQ